MAGIAVSREVAATAERTWAVMTDLARAPEMLSAVTAIERLDGAEGFHVGTRWRETRRMFGREATEEMEVTAVEPGRAYTVEADSGGTHYVSSARVEPLGEGRSRIEMSFDGEARGLMARVLSATVGRFMAGSMRRALQRDLDDIARAAESA